MAVTAYKYSSLSFVGLKATANHNALQPNLKKLLSEINAKLSDVYMCLATFCCVLLKTDFCLKQTSELHFHIYFLTIGIYYY